MTRYTYHGPASGLTLADGTELLLWPNQTVELPSSDVVDALRAQGYLQPVAEPDPEAAPTPKKTAARKE
ncbi:MAG: hypothetical protein AB1735_02095 [Pseudomonadota bacterium]